MTVASLALSANAFAAGGNGKDTKGKDSTRTESEKREEARKLEQAGKAGNSAKTMAAQEAATSLLNKTRVVVGGSDIKEVSERLAVAVDSGILKQSDLELLEQNSNKEVAVNAANLLSVAAMKNQLKSGDTNATGLVTFIQREVSNNLSGKTQWTTDAEAKLNTTLIEATRALKDGDTSSIKDAVVAGLKKAGFSEERVKEILKECFKIVA